MTGRGRTNWKQSGWELLVLGFLALLLACGGGDDDSATGKTLASGDSTKEQADVGEEGGEEEASAALASLKARDFDWPSEPSAVVVLEIQDMGEIRIGLYDSIAPVTVAHFLDVAARGLYDETIFHRVLKGFMVQGGDPGTKPRPPGTNKPYYPYTRVDDEYNDTPNARGVVAMANRGTEGSTETQFFIVQQDSPHLDGKYSTFGRVLSGMDVVDAIAEVEVDEFGRWGDSNRPLKDVVLVRVRVEGRGVAVR